MGLSMIYFSEDKNIDKLSLTAKNIINNLSNEQVKAIVYSLGADRHEETSKGYIFPTICHNRDVSEASMKLYYYFDRKIFVCYTECNEAFNIFTLIEKVKEINGEECNYYNARDYVLNFLDCENIIIHEQKYSSVLEKYRPSLHAETLKEYDSNILRTFINAPYIGWLDEGMSAKAIREFNIGYSIDKEAIIIPHYDINDRLIGIRARNLNYTKENDMPKYCPLITKHQMYNHSLGMNLYGLNVTKGAVKNTKRVFLFEGEKSVILMRTFYGSRANACAVCGSNITRPQMEILIKNCNVQEVIIAFDKEFSDYNSKKADNYFNKLYELGKQFNNYAKISFIYDTKNLLDEKDSPVDKGKEIFEELYHSRIYIRS